MKRFLRARLQLLVLLAVVPALLLMAFTAVEQRRINREDTERDTQRLVALESTTLERSIVAARDLLTVTATLPEVLAGGPACDRRLAALLEQSDDLNNLGVIAPGGNVLCSALPATKDVNLGDRSYFRAAMETQKFAVGTYQIGRVTGLPSVNFGLPVMREGRPAAVLFAALDLSRLNDLPIGLRLPTGSVFNMVDAAGTVLVRWPNPEKWVGRQFALSGIVRAMKTQGSGTVETSGFDDVVRLFSFQPLAGTSNEAFASVGIPAGAAFAEARAGFVRNLLLMGLVGILAMLAAWFAGNAFVVRPTQEALARERDAVERLRELDEMKNAFLAAVAHDFRNPLTSILGFAKTMQSHEGDMSAAQRDELLERISNSATRLERLLSDLLDMERVARGTAAAQRAPTDLTEMARRVVADLRVTSHPVTVEGLPVTGDVDAGQVERILDNLLSNAVKYTPPGTQIWIRVRREEDGVLITVDDAGPGVGDEDLKRQIFEPFRRGNTQRSGTGLGLHLVASFAELHQGRAWVEDRPGGGSSFRVLLTDSRADQSRIASRRAR